jgi:structural maintenance of chromosome 3 (chondroitin sulfate proteoglycan 6)
VKESSAKEECDTLNTELQQFIKDKTRMELVIKDLRDEVVGDNKSKDRAEQELSKLRETITVKDADLEQIKPQYEEMKKREEECTRELALKEQKCKELYAKQGRGSQFTSKEQRDEWIKKELKSLYKQIKDKTEQIDRLAEDLKRDGVRRSELEKHIEGLTSEQDQFRSTLDEQSKGFYEQKKRKDALQAERNELCRKEMNLQQSLSALKEEYGKADQTLRSMAGKPILNGRDSVRKVLTIFRERGGSMELIANSYYGLVIENFECEQSIYTAVEVTAGNRLFHHIVESDRVGTQILKEMNKQKLPGEVTFMPLNRLNVRPIEYPTTKDAIAMVTKLDYKGSYDKALR